MKNRFVFSKVYKISIAVAIVDSIVSIVSIADSSFVI